MQILVQIFLVGDLGVKIYIYIFETMIHTWEHLNIYHSYGDIILKSISIEGSRCRG